MWGRQKGAKSVLQNLPSDMMTSLVKVHFSKVVLDSKQADDLVMGSSDEMVVHFEGFFNSVASQGGKLCESLLLEEVSKFVLGNNEKLKKFCKAIVSAQQYAWLKKKQMTSGRKLEPAVLRVAKAYREWSDDLPKSSEKMSRKRIPPAEQTSAYIHDESKVHIKIETEVDPLSIDQNLASIRSLFSMASPAKKVKSAAQLSLLSPFSVASSIASPQIKDREGASSGRRGIDRCHASIKILIIRTLI